MSIRFFYPVLQALLLVTLLFFSPSLLADSNPTPKATSNKDSTKSSTPPLEKSLFSALSKNDMTSWLKSLDKEQPLPDSTETLRTAELLSTVLTSNSKELQKQYRDHLKLYPDSKGKILLKLFVTPPGAVDKVEITSCSMDKNFENQIIETIGKWKNLGFCDCDCIKIYVQEFIFGETGPQ